MISKNECKERFKLNGIYKSPYDSRDYRFKDALPMGAIYIPDNPVIEKLDPAFIYDQGQTSMCAACGSNAVRFRMERKQSGLDQLLSPAYTYGSRLEGEESMEGLYMRSVCKMIKNFGGVLFTELPGFYSTEECIKLVNANLADLRQKATPYLIDSFYACRSRKEVQTAILTTGAVIAGIYVFDCFYEPNVLTEEVAYDPKKHYQSDGGHCVVFDNWKIDSNGKLWWRVQNSWGSEWGGKGYCWIPETYPWMDDCYAFVDNTNLMTFAEYKEKFYATGEVTTVKTV